MGVDTSRLSSRERAAALMSTRIQDVESLDNKLYQTLIGSMLGDGCVRTCGAGRTHRYTENHCTEQRDYINWKDNIMKPLLSTTTTISSRVCNLSTLSHPFMNKLRDEFYKDKDHKSYIPDWVAPKLDLLGTLVWYMDDGGLASGIPVITACVFTKRDVEKLASKIGTLTNTRPYVYKNTSDTATHAQKKIRVYKSEAPVMIEALRSIATEVDLPDCMWYKIGGK